MARVRTCDACGKPSEKIVLKLFKVPANTRLAKDNYTHHADIGICCVNKINQINWTPRKKNDKRVESAA